MDLSLPVVLPETRTGSHERIRQHTAAFFHECVADAVDIHGPEYIVNKIHRGRRLKGVTDLIFLTGRSVTQ